MENIKRRENLFGLCGEIKVFLREQGIEQNGELVLDQVKEEKGVKRMNRAYFIFHFRESMEEENTFFLKIDIAIKKIKKAFIFEKVTFKKEQGYLAKVFFSLEYVTEEGSRF